MRKVLKASGYSFTFNMLQKSGKERVEEVVFS